MALHTGVGQPAHPDGWAGRRDSPAQRREGLPPRTRPGGGTHRSSGGHLRAELGDGCVAVAATVGEVDDGSVPPTPAQFTEAPLSVIDAGSLPLRDVETPPAVQDWLDGPWRTRLVGPHYDPAADADHHVTGPSVRDALDGFLHVRRSAPMRPLRSTA
ncbi:erythromycin esterase family protein [Salinifilum ghardaiensis]